jgi:hypothetical protein
VRGGVDEQLRPPQLGGDLCEPLEVAVCLLEHAVVEQRDRPPDARAGFEVRIGKALTRRDQLVGELEPRRLLTGMPVRVLSGHECPCERLDVVEPPRHIERLPTQCVLPFDGRLEVVEDGAEPSKNLRA